MTPDELALIEEAADSVVAHPAAFADSFYKILFSVSPSSRALFGDDLSVQKEKLVSEVAFLIAATSDLDAFVDRARELGRRHGDYGVTAADFEPVWQALSAALQTVLGDDVTEAHITAWSKLYRLIAATMLEGMNENVFAER